MSGDLSKILKDQFRSAQHEYELFYYHRNHPAPGVEFEDRAQLSDEQRGSWAKRMNDQAVEMLFSLDALQKSAETLGEGATLLAFRPYHEMRNYFREDVREMSDQIGPFGFAPAI